MSNESRVGARRIPAAFSVFSFRRAAVAGTLALLFSGAMAAAPSVLHARPPAVGVPVGDPPATQPTITSVEKVRGTADAATVRVEWDEPALGPIVDWARMPRTGFCYFVTEFVSEISQGRREYCRTSDDTFVEFDVSVPPRKRLGIRVRMVFEDGQGRGFHGSVSDEASITLEP